MDRSYVMPRFPKVPMFVLSAALLLGPCSHPRAVRADIYRFVDSRGVVHFSNAPSRPGYRLYMREVSPSRSRPSHMSVMDYGEIVHRAASRYGVDENLIKALIAVESDSDPHARSSKGAMGLMQLMPQTARDLGVRDPWDPEENIEAGVRHLRVLLDTFNGEVRLALAAYNAGLDAVMKYGGVPPFGETRRYVSKVLRHWRRYAHQASGEGKLH